MNCVCVSDHLIDGVNIDIEGNTANRDELTALVSELNRELKAVEPAYQLSFDLGISPDGQKNGYACQTSYYLPVFALSLLCQIYIHVALHRSGFWEG